MRSVNIDGSKSDYSNIRMNIMVLKM